MSADSFYDEVNLKDLPLKCQISEVYVSAILDLYGRLYVLCTKIHLLISTDILPLEWDYLLCIYWHLCVYTVTAKPLYISKNSIYSMSKVT